MFVKVSEALDEHLTDEENEILPLVSVHITEAEWHALGHRLYPRAKAQLVSP